MKVVLFCGGLGMRLRSYSEEIPKPMVPVGHRPILWHVMKYYAHFGHKDFILCLGYGAEAIKRYFLDYEEAVNNDFILKQGNEKVLMGTDIDDWTITFADTGFSSAIGERLRRVKHYLEEDEIFLANYADGVTNLDLNEYVETFVSKNKVAGFLAVRPPQSYHVAQVDGDDVVSLGPIGAEDLWLNGGYFVFKKEIFDYIDPGVDLVEEPFHRLIDEKKLFAHRFDDYWSPMDTFKERQYLEKLYLAAEAPWALWRDGDP